MVQAVFPTCTIYILGVINTGPMQSSSSIFALVSCELHYVLNAVSASVESVGVSIKMSYRYLVSASHPACFLVAAILHLYVTAPGEWDGVMHIASASTPGTHAVSI